MEPIFLYDTTLRDGTQGENISFSADEKVKIAERRGTKNHHMCRAGQDAASVGTTEVERPPFAGHQVPRTALGVDRAIVNQRA